MHNRNLRWLVVTVAAVLLLGSIVAVGFGQQIGTKDHPIYMLFPPSTNGAAVQRIGAQIAEDLYNRTGLYIKPVLEADYAAMIEAFAASDGDTFGVPTTNMYLGIFDRTNGNVTPRLGAVRYGYPYYFASIYYWRDSGIKSVQDLAGKVWIYNDPESTSGYVLPSLLFKKLGLTFDQNHIVESGGHTNSMVALLNHQGDFCTGYGSPPIPPAGCSLQWQYGDDPELWIWDRYNNQLFRPGLRGKCVDLRHAVHKTFDEETVLKEIGVLTTIGPVPNDCLAFGPNFPKDIADKIVEAVKAQFQDEKMKALWGDPEFYEWKGVQDIDDSFYDGYRELLGKPIPQR